MRWLIAAFSLQSSPPGLVLTGMNLTISTWSCSCSSPCLICHQPPPPPGCATAASGGPMHMPSCQGRARPLLLAAQLQPLLISTARQQLAVPIWSWQMPSFALPLTPQPRLHLCGADNMGRGVSPPPVMLPLVEPQVPHATVAAAASQASLAS